MSKFWTLQEETEGTIPKGFRTCNYGNST